MKLHPMLPLLSFLVSALLLSACSGKSDAGKWSGTWLRTDGTYRLEISLNDSGSPEVGYFNPNPIHVEKAEFREETGSRQLVVTLNDFNYPGAIYSLKYSPESDRLEGSYYNPRAGRPFPIAFARQQP